MFLDPSLLVLCACAISCIWYGSVRSYSFFNEVKDTTPQEIKFVQTKKILLLPIIGSIVLVVLFFVLDFSITVWILFAVISIMVFASQFFVFAPLFDYIFDRIFKEPKGFTLPKLGFIPVSGICLGVWCAGVIAIWVTTHHWTVVDGIAWCLGITQLCVLRLPSLKLATLLLVPFLIYDVFWVFISPIFFNGESVMVSVAMRMPPLPLLLKVPQMTSDGFSGLGLGDIALPGLFVVFLYSFDKHLGKTNTIDLSSLGNSYLTYFTLSLIQYLFGFIVTLIGGYIMDSGQPALLYLVPALLGITPLIAWRRGDLALMWNGHHKDTDEKSKDIEAQTLLGEGEQTRDSEGNVTVNMATLDLKSLNIEHAAHESARNNEETPNK